MRLVRFSVTNYRSITSAHEIPISDSTILIGKNNEGKSNLLNALATSMVIIREHARQGRWRRPIRYRAKEREEYYWERDFPISLQRRKRKGETIFRLEFELSGNEIEEFKKEVKSNLNGSLPVEIRIDEKHEPKFKILKRGLGGATLSKKPQVIANFIGKRLDFSYIPAVRTEEAAINVVNEMLENELFALEDDEEYRRALEKIAQLQQPILETVSKKIAERLKSFIPQIKSVEVTIPADARQRALRRQCEIMVDDGTPTLIEMKGDGVKSLAALSLLLGTRQRAASSILALEEPESHLHPSAIHLLREVIQELSKKHQVVLTTHCPLFVDRMNIGTNILVTDKKAKPAKKIAEIRDLLGVRASDNLTHAALVLVVEGDEDKISLEGLLTQYSDKIGSALRNYSFVIEPIGGAGNLPYKLSLLNSALCNFHVYLDNDEAGRKGIQDAERDGQLRMKDYTQVICHGQTDSEFEDMIDKEVYKEKLLDDFGVTLHSNTFGGNKKWSERMKATFMSQGKQWNKTIAQRVKGMIAELVAKQPDTALNTHKRSSFDALITTIESKLTNL